MNSMHNSFGSGSGGGYSGPYPGYVPPSALPYYNGYPSELAASQTPGAYYGKPSASMPGYSSGMAGYSAPNINNSMYYQQYGLGYQYGYGKYGLGAGLTTSLGYGSELGGPASIAPSSLGGLQAPTTDLGLTGSMFSKGSSSGSLGGNPNKYSNLGNASPHSIASSQSNSVISAVTPTPPSASPHSIPNALRGHGATPSPPVDPSEGKKDLEKMRRCQLCGQVFRLMSECLAHMKAVHEAPMSMYGMPHSSHGGQSMVPPHLQSHGPSRSSTMSTAPDSPLMALERMGWGKEQGLMPSLHSSSPISQPYPSPASAQAHQAQSMSSHQITMVSNPHLSDPRYGDPSQQSAKRLNDFYNSCNTNTNMNHEQNLSAIESHHHHPSSTSSGVKSRKSSSYSVSSIIGENSDSRRERRELMERGASGEPPQTHSPSLPPSLTPNLPVTSTPSLPPNLSPNLPAQLQQTLPSTHNLSSQPPQLTPNIPSNSQPMNLNSNAHMNQQPPTLSPSYSSHSHVTPVESPSSVSSTSAVYHPPTTQSKSDPHKPDLTNNIQSGSQYYSSVNYGETSQSRMETVQHNSHCGNTEQQGMPNDSNNVMEQHYQQYNQQETQLQHNHQISNQPHKEDKKLDDPASSEQTVNLSYHTQRLMSQQLQSKPETMSHQDFSGHKYALDAVQQNSPASKEAPLQDAQYEPDLNKSPIDSPQSMPQVQQYHEHPEEQSHKKDSTQITSNQHQDLSLNESSDVQHEKDQLSLQDNFHEQSNCQQDHIEQADRDHQMIEPVLTNQSEQETKANEVKDFPQEDCEQSLNQCIEDEQQKQQTSPIDEIDSTQKLAQEGPDDAKEDLKNGHFLAKQSLAHQQSDQVPPVEISNVILAEDENTQTMTNFEMAKSCKDSSQREKLELTVASCTATAEDAELMESGQLRMENSVPAKERSPQSLEQDNLYQSEGDCRANSLEQNAEDYSTDCSKQVGQLNDNQEEVMSNNDMEACKVEAVHSGMSPESEQPSNTGNYEHRDDADSEAKTEYSDINKCNEVLDEPPKAEYNLNSETEENKQENDDHHIETSPVQGLQEVQRYPSALEDDIGDEDEPGDPALSIPEAEMSPNSNSQPTSWSGSNADPLQGQETHQHSLQPSVQSPLQVPPHHSELSVETHSSEQTSAQNSSEQPCAPHHNEQPSAPHHNEQPNAPHHNEQPSALHHLEQKNALHQSEQSSASQFSEQSSASQFSEQSSTQLNPDPQSAQHSEQLIASHHAEQPGSQHILEQPTSHSSQYYQQKQTSQSAEYGDKASMPLHQSPQKSQQAGPFRGSWPAGYPTSGTSSYQYHQYGGQSPSCGPNPAMMSQQAGSSKMQAYAPHSRYPNQYPNSGYDNRRPMSNPYPAQGHWYPAAPGRGDTKPPWTGWASAQSHGYPQSYFYGGSSAASSSQHIQQQQQHSSPQHKYPPHQTSPLPTTPKPAKDNLIPPPVTPPQSTPPAPPESPVKTDEPEVTPKIENLNQETTPESLKKSMSKTNPTIKPRSKRNRPGPKSRVDRKLQAESNGIQPALASPLQNGTVNPPALTPPATATSNESSDSSDNEVDDEPRLAVLKPAKRFKGPDGSFVGPKRVKLAKMVRQRQHTRQKLIQDQIKQSELEEQLTQQWVERASEQEGPLANVLLKSSLLLGDQNVEESEVMEECIASMTAQLLPVQTSSEQESHSGKEKPQASTNGTLLGIKKPGRKAYPSKVLHNNNSVVIKTHGKQKFVPKLRAKDFKWSHYIKSMRFWCKDCGHGFKNQKESTQHGEEQCKWNCLYMIECYVSVTDIVQHKLYGSKVEELLEEYQVDGEHKCGRCGIIVSRKADYLVHVDTHKDFMPWECTICGTRFKIRGSLKEHLRYTHMKGRVPCLKCNKVFATSTLLRQHVKVHTQHYKYNRTGKHREEDLRVARETEEDLDDTGTPGEQLSHEANEYRNWCKLMELNAMKNIATSDMVENNPDAMGELSGGEEGGLLNAMESATPTNVGTS